MGRRATCAAAFVTLVALIGAPASTAFGATTVDEVVAPVPLDSPTGSYIVVLEECPGRRIRRRRRGSGADSAGGGRETRPAFPPCPEVRGVSPEAPGRGRRRGGGRARDHLPGHPQRVQREDVPGGCGARGRDRRRPCRLSRRDLPSRRRAAGRPPGSRRSRRRVGIARRSGCRRHRRRGRRHRHGDRAREPVLRRGAPQEGQRC